MSHSASVGPADLHMFQWRIREFVSGPTYCIPVPAGGQAELDDVRAAIATVIDEEFISECVFEYRRMDSEEPWQPLNAKDHGGRRFTADCCIAGLEDLHSEGFALSAEPVQRLQRLLPAFGPTSRVRGTTGPDGGAS